MNHLKIFAAGGMALILASSALALGQTAPSGVGSTVTASQSPDVMDEELAEQITQAWSEGKDASGAVTFQVKGEIALSQGNPQQARGYFKAAEHELTVLQPSPVGALPSDY